MPGQSDGSIIVDTEINSEGFKAGSSELLSAIKSLSSEIRELGKLMKETFSGNGANFGNADSSAQQYEATIAALNGEISSLKATVTGLQEQLSNLGGSNPAQANIDTSEAEQKIVQLESRIQELESELSRLQGQGGSAPTISFDHATSSASSLERSLESVSNRIDSLAPTAQRAMNGSASALASFEAKANQLDVQIDKLAVDIDAFGDKKIPTEQYTALTAEISKTENTLSSLIEKQRRMRAIGVNENSAAWRGLQYDIKAAKNHLNEYKAALADLQSSGETHISGADTAVYQQMVDGIAAATAQLVEMRNSVAEASAGMGEAETHANGLGNALKRALGTVGGIARSIGGKLDSSIKSAASHMAKMATHSRAMKNQFGGLISGAQRFALSLLGARGVYALLRKAVSAYMQENQQLSATLSSCWSAIGNILGPIITRLVNLVATAVAYLTQFLSLLGFVGKSTSKAISSAGGAAKKETDKLKRQLASFDELNILQDNSSDDTGGGGGADPNVGALPNVELPDWVKQMVDQLKSGQWAEAAKTLTSKLNEMVDNVDWEGIGKKLAYSMNGAFTFLATAITTFDWYNLGASLGKMINQIIYGVDWGNLGIILGSKFIILIEGLGGLFATLDWAALGKAFADGLMGLWNAIDWAQAGKTISDGMIGLIESISTFIANVDWQKIGDDISTFLQNIDWSGITSGICYGIGAAAASLGELVWGLLRDAIFNTGDYFNAYIEDAKAAGGSWLDGVLQGIGDGIVNIGQWIWDNVFLPIYNGFCDAFGIHSPSTVMAEAGGFIIAGLLQGITDGWGSITEFFTTALSSIGESISTTWADVKSWTSTTWESVKGSVSTALENAKQKTSKTCSDIGSSASSTWSNLKSKTSTAWTNIGSTLSKAWDDMKSCSTKDGSDISSTTSSNFSQVKSYVNSNLSNAKSTLTSAFNSMKSTVSSSTSSISSTVSSKFSSIHSTINSKMSSVKSLISSGFSSVQSSITSKMQSAMNTVKSQNWYSVGSNICSGIANGINAGWSWLRSTVSNMASNLLSSAKSALGIHSPSRLFRDAVGLNIGYGIGEGIEDSEGSVLKSVTGVADAIADEFNAGDYTVNAVVPAAEVNGSLTSFADKITDSFSLLMNRLQAIADNVVFATPVVANGLTPYKTAAADSGSNSNVGDVIEASNGELGTVIIQAVTNATVALVKAIEENGGTVVNVDMNSITTGVIQEINRRTIMNGKSPLLI